MIVRCNNCVSAFAVDDEKVANKKFAFTCPKCGSENIIDNRIEEKNLPAEESLFNDDFSIDTESSEKEIKQPGTPEAYDDEMFFDETPAEKEDKFDSTEFDLDAELPVEDSPAEPEKKERKINLEIEESTDFSDLDEELFAEKSAPEKKGKGDELLKETPEFETEEDFISFDDNETVRKPAEDFEIELKEDTVKPEEEDTFFDDFDETPESSEKPAKKDVSIDDEPDFDFEDIDAGISSEEEINERDKKLKSQDDIDALFAEEGIVFDEKPISKQNELDFEDEITIDLDELDIELEESGDENLPKKEPVDADSVLTEDSSPEDIKLDMDNLDIDLDETSLDSDIFEEAPKSAGAAKKQAPSDEDITLDLDNLDIDLDETSLDSDIFEETPKSAGAAKKQTPSDEDITLDMDNLDIDLEETLPESDFIKEPVAVKSTKIADKKNILPEDEFNDEDIKLNLDDLDIDLDEIEERELIFEDDVIEKSVTSSAKKAKPLVEEEDEDESITIDLDSLEIEIAEENNAKAAELSEEDEKLTLDDAGLTFDELTSEIEKNEFDESVDEDIKLTLNEIDPDLTLDKIASSGRVETERVSDTLDELPEIDLDEYDAFVRQEDSREIKKQAVQPDDEFVIFPDSDIDRTEVNKPDYDIFDYEESEHEKSLTESGSTFFTIDFSLKYSRLGALLRLLGLYGLSLIPHFVVMLIYTILSSILGFINQLVILSTGRCVEDFALVIENTMRYIFYIETNMTGIVEDRPVYAGRESIDHPLQLDITYPVKYSKNLAVLRLSIVGMILITLPHLIIMSLITVTIPIVYFIGIISVIISRRWPNILFTYMTRYFRYLARISSFMAGLTDEYPPFSFD